MNVSAVHAEYNGKKRTPTSRKKRSKTGVEDWYYNAKEFKALTKTEQEELRELRATRQNKKSKSNKWEKKPDSVSALT